MNKPKRRLIFLAVVFALTTLACGTLSVANQSDFKVLVSVTLPGSNSTDSHLYKPGEVYDYYPESSGKYTISVIPQEDYIKEMDRLRTNILGTLYINQNTLESDMIIPLTKRLATIEQTLSSLTTHSCSGNFVDDSSISAAVNMSKQGEITLTCPSSESQNTDN